MAAAMKSKLRDTPSVADSTDGVRDLRQMNIVLIGGNWNDIERVKSQAVP